MSQTVFTHNLSLSSSLQLLCLLCLATTIRSPWYNSNFIQLSNLAFRYGHKSKANHHDHGDCTRLAFPFIKDIAHGKSWKIIQFFPKPVERIAKTSSTDHIFLCNPSVLHKGTPQGENLLTYCLSQIWTLHHLLKGLWLSPYRISHLRQ